MNQNIIQETLSSIIINTDSFKSLKLSPNDWIIPSFNTISCIYFYDIQQWVLHKTQPVDMFINTERLILSLRKLLDYYPLLTGILRSFDNDNKVSVEQGDNKGGILFVSTKVSISLNELPLSIEDYTDIKKLPEALQLINIVDSDTLFHVRHTRFLCGSVALGISLNHQVADAHSYFQLVKHWVELYKNLEYQPNVCHQRSFLEPTLTEIQTLKTSNPNFNNQKSLSFKQENSSAIQQLKQTIIKIFRFSADELNRMKLDARTHLSSNVSHVSTFEVLSAHLHQHVMLARNHTTSPITKLYITTNIRPRLTQPPIPLTYFGNAIMLTYLETNTTNSLGLLASQIHKSIEEMTNDNIRTSLAWIICQEDKTKIMPTWNLDETDFTITAWNKMGMYSDSDFELGIYPYRIIFPQDTKFHGAVTLFSTEKNDASIDVYLGLDINEMERLEKNCDFRKYRI